MIISSIGQLNKLDRDKLYYLASPYTAKGLTGHAKRQLEHDRYLTITHIGVVLFAEHGLLLLTPITASHGMAMHDPTNKLGGNWEQFAALDTKQITQSDGGIIVAMMPGWKESTGVTAEIQHAKALGKPIYYLEPRLVIGVKNAVRTK